MKTLGLYFLATRPQFFTAIIIPVALGAAAAWHYTSGFNTGLFALSLAAGVLYHAGLNVANDYFDFLNGTDNFNTDPLTPFAGGSRMIQKGLMTPRATLLYAAALLTAATAIGLYLAWAVGWELVVFGIIGLSSGILYSAPPVFLAGRGLGEVLVGLNFGVLSVAGSYYVQTSAFQWEVLLISLPLSFLIAAILYINEFPDYEADKSAGKRNLVVRLGPERARYGLAVLLACAYLSLILGAALGGLTPLTLAALASSGFAWKAGAGLIREYRGGKRLEGPIKNLIATHLLTGLLQTGAFII